MIQIDMEMPKCCDECFALDDHGDYPYCLISQDQRGYTFNVRENRMPSCPLKAQEPMDDLISRWAAIDALTDTNLKRNVDSLCDGDMNRTRRAAQRVIASLPAVDAVPVVHARWEEVEDVWGDLHYRCFACGCKWFLEDGTPAENGMNYCPHCGARMDKEDEHGNRKNP